MWAASSSAAHTTVSTSVAAAGVSDSAGCNTGPGWSSIIRNDAAAEERGGCEELCRRVAAPAALQRASPSFHSTAASARACGGGYERSSLCAARGPLAGWLAAAGMTQRHRARATLMAQRSCDTELIRLQAIGAAAATLSEPSRTPRMRALAGPCGPHAEGCGGSGWRPAAASEVAGAVSGTRTAQPVRRLAADGPGSANGGVRSTGTPRPVGIGS